MTRQPRTLAARIKVATEYASYILARTPLDGADLEYARKVIFQYDQARMAEALGVSRRSTLSAWETGKVELKRYHWLAVYTLIIWWLDDSEKAQ